ncbi:MAG: DUF2891 family protein [Caulobacterales bacterium]
MVTAVVTAMAAFACHAPAADNVVKPQVRAAQQALPVPPAIDAAAMARAFAAQAAACAARRDTAHEAFHGCVDWHSAAHADWALSAYAVATGDDTYEPQVAARLTAHAVKAEAALLRAQPAFEMPYGRAWFLRLARTRGEDVHLRAMAQETARSLRAHYTAFPTDPLAQAYDNPSWALLNLLQYARAANDPALEAFVVDLVRRDFLAPACPIAADAEDFMAVCTTWAWLVAETLPIGEFKTWYAGWNPGLERLEPLTRYSSAHQYGINFSRAWGLGRLARLLDDPALERAYRAHLAAGFEPADRWKGDYMANGHWVAQFGMLAVEPLLN